MPKTKTSTKKPSDFTTFPWDSKSQDHDTEQIALNIMIILGRTGNAWRALSWEEYKTEREKDANFSNIEKKHFEKAIEYCSSAEQAQTFSDEWAEKKEVTNT